MNVEIKVDENMDDSKIIIFTKSVTPELSSLITNIESNHFSKIIGTIEDRKFILNITDILHFYAENNKVYARDSHQTYTIHYKLYELEKILENTSFVRISNSEIINFNQIDSFSYKDSTIYVYFKNGNYTYVSRRYIPKIKKYLNMI